MTGDGVRPDISLVMPVWRPRPEWLHEAVRSALDQHGCDLELIIVDDGNETPVADVLVGVSDPRIRHLRIAHGGVSAARNAGLDVAAGGFVRFVDADDVLEPGSTARLRAISAPGVIGYEDTVVCDEQLNPQRRISSRLRGDIAVPCLLGQFDSRHVSMLFPRPVIDRAGPWDTGLRVREDFDFVLRCLEHADVAPGEGTATFYRRHDSSATWSEQAVHDAQRSSRLVVAAFFERHPALRHSAVFREAWRRLYTAEARTALHQEQLGRAMASVFPLLRLAPGEAARLGLRVARRGVILSGRAIAGTMARVRGGRPHRARRS